VPRAHPGGGRGSFAAACPPPITTTSTVPSFPRSSSGQHKPPPPSGLPLLTDAELAEHRVEHVLGADRPVTRRSRAPRTRSASPRSSGNLSPAARSSQPTASPSPASGAAWRRVSAGGSGIVGQPPYLLGQPARSSAIPAPVSALTTTSRPRAAIPGRPCCRQSGLRRRGSERCPRLRRHPAGPGKNPRRRPRAGPTHALRLDRVRVSRNPAVSSNVTGTPPITRRASSTSRVVPGAAKRSPRRGRPAH